MRARSWTLAPMVSLLALGGPGCASPYHSTLRPNADLTAYVSLEVAAATVDDAFASRVAREELLALRRELIRNIREEKLFSEVVESGALGQATLVLHTRIVGVGYGGIARFLLGYGRDAGYLELAVSLADRAGGTILASTNIQVDDPGSFNLGAEALSRRTMKILFKYLRTRGRV